MCFSLKMFSRLNVSFHRQAHVHIYFQEQLFGRQNQPKITFHLMKNNHTPLILKIPLYPHQWTIQMIGEQG